MDYNTFHAKMKEAKLMAKKRSAKKGHSPKYAAGKKGAAPKNAAAEKKGASADNAAAKKEGAQKKGKPRVFVLDELRGFAIFCMIFFHAFYTVGYFFNIKWGKVLVDFFMPAEPYFAALFIVISGIACCLTHSNLERGVKLAIISAVISLVTYLVLGSSEMIRFGILHMLSVGMILYGLFHKYLRLIPNWFGLLVNTFLFVFSYRIVDRSLGLPFLFKIHLPAEWYSTSYLFIFGLPDYGFVSSDYFPIFPWIFLFFAGAFLGRIAVKRGFPKFMMKKRIGFLAFMGRKSLIIYLAHQPVIFGICYAVIWFIKLFK